MDFAGQYLNEIARFPQLLTAGQEIQLGRTELTGLQPSDFHLMAQSYYHKSSDDPLFGSDQKVSIIDAFSELNPRAGDSFESGHRGKRTD
jgi:hypothetical protein